MDDKKPNRIIPNAYQSPNFYVDDLLPLLTGEEWKCMSFVIRKTLGWQKFSDRLAKSVIASATGLSEGTVDKCMANLVSFGLIERKNENTGAHDGIEYGVQMHDEKIVWSALEDRKQAIKTRNSKRIESARKALKIKALATQHVAQTPSVPQPGRSAVPQPPTPSVPQGTQKPIKTKILTTTGGDQNASETTDEEKAKAERVFKHFQDNICMLTPVLADQIGDAIDRYPEAWITDAINEAVVNSARKWSYINTILTRWSTEGRDKKKETPHVTNNRSGNFSGAKTKQPRTVTTYTEADLAAAAAINNM